MGQALEAIDVPAIRPPGVTARQWRLAAIYPRAESAYAAMIAAGYAPKTALQNARHQLGTIGVARARQAIAESQADRARGLVGKGVAALDSARLEDLSSLEKLQFGLKAVEVGHNLGENIESAGSASAWRQRLRRAIRLAYRFGVNRGRAPQDLVVIPPADLSST